MIRRNIIVLNHRQLHFLIGRSPTVTWRSAAVTMLFLMLAVPLVWGGVDDDEQIGFIWQPPVNAETAVWK